MDTANSLRFIDTGVLYIIMYARNKYIYYSALDIFFLSFHNFFDFIFAISITFIIFAVLFRT